MRAIASLIAIALTLGLFAPQAAAQDDAMRKKVMEKVRALRAALLIEHLDLDEKDATRLFPILNEFDDEIMAVHAEMGPLHRELRQQLRSGSPDEKRINRLVDALLQARDKLHKLETRRIREVRKALSSVKAAQLIVALPEIDREIQKRIRQALRDRKRGRMEGERDRPRERRRRAEPFPFE